MIRAGMWLLRQVGQAARILFIAALTVSLGSLAVWGANYTLTQGLWHDVWLDCGGWR